MTALLASVSSAYEARIALQSYADLIDCKNPFEGALGALPLETITGIVETVGGARLVSATTGDLIQGTRQLRDAVAATADCGVDYVKFGLFEHERAYDQLHALRDKTDEVDLIAVCFADRYDPHDLLPRLADGGFRGVMIDTADKSAGRLTELWSTDRLAGFVREAHDHALLCGLAGRLRLADIPCLLPLQADYLGFRGALCRGQRYDAIDDAAMMAVREAIPFRVDTATIQQPHMALH